MRIANKETQKFSVSESASDGYLEESTHADDGRHARRRRTLVEIKEASPLLHRPTYVLVSLKCKCKGSHLAVFPVRYSSDKHTISTRSLTKIL